MEDSYTVHRRRKAAARKRDKTPEASRAVKDQHEVQDDEEDNEKLEARARIERMVEDTERMEEMFNDGRNKSPDNANSRTTISPKDNNDDNVDNVTQVNDDIKIDERINDDEEKIIEGKSVIIDGDKENAKKYQQERTEESQVNSTTTNENRMDFKRVIKVKAETSRRDRERRLKERWSSSDSSRGAHDDKSDKEEIVKRGKKPRKIRKERKDEQQQQQQQQQFPSSTLTHTSKQIIPLSDESLLEDLLKAQREYERREVGILDVQIDDYVHPQMVAALRQRKVNSKQIEIKHQDSEDNPVKVPGSWSKVFTWLWSFVVNKKNSLIEEKKLINEDDEKSDEEQKKIMIEEKIPIKCEQIVEKESKFIGFLHLLSDIKAEFKAFVDKNPREILRLRQSRNRCIAELILIIIYCGLGAFIFRFIEGAFETFYKCGVKRVKRDFLDSLWNYSHNLREDDWKSMARRKLMEFEEQLHAAHEAGVHSYSGQKSWSFLNAVVYCLTVITTIGYGHISPSTTTGRAVTIIYAIFGIPLFLIILADFGKLFTRGIKFLWAFVRRLYYTGSCRRVRRTGPVQVIKR